MGEIGILNVGAGDTKITFDKSNPAETIRAGRIVRDMLRRGYALLVEVDVKGDKKAFRRAEDFDENTGEYIIADFDPVTAEKADQQEAAANAEDGGGEAAAAATAAEPPAETPRKRGYKRIAASSTRGVAVARTAGG